MSVKLIAFGYPVFVTHAFTKPPELFEPKILKIFILFFSFTTLTKSKIEYVSALSFFFIFASTTGNLELTKFFFKFSNFKFFELFFPKRKFFKSLLHHFFLNKKMNLYLFLGHQDKRLFF